MTVIQITSRLLEEEANHSDVPEFLTFLFRTK